MQILRTLFTLSFACLICFTTYGQRKKTKADKLYTNYSYMAAADLYNKLSSDGQTIEPEVMAKLANIFRLNGDVKSAVFWYAKFVEQSNNPEDYLHYAQVLQSAGDCENALNWFEKYKKSITEKRSYVEDCQEINEMVANDIEVHLVDGINGTYADFCPVPFQNGIVFTSTRGVDYNTKIDKWTNEYFSDLFYAELDDNGNFLDPIPLYGEVNNSKFHDGTATFNPMETSMVFSRNNTSGFSSEKVRDIKLYMAEYNETGWGNISEFPFNDKEFTTCHPALSTDGKKLYFTSNRTGGFGGMDIYVSEKVGGIWQAPKNLGDVVNTAGNELFPYFAANGQLYIASDGHLGLGGLDIFAVTQTTPGNESTWGEIKNMEAPINSTKDDFGFTIDEDEQSGFVSSNRNNGIGGDDIYQWQPPTTTFTSINTCISDAESGEALSNAKVTVIEGDINLVSSLNELLPELETVETDDKTIMVFAQSGDNSSKLIQQLHTDDNGNITIPGLSPETAYSLIIEKEGFQPMRMVIGQDKILEKEQPCLALARNKSLLLQGIVLNKKFETEIPNAVVDLYNKCTGETRTVRSQSNGSFEFELDCDCEYEVMASKESFSKDIKELSTLKIPCQKADPLYTTLNIGKQESALAANHTIEEGAVIQLPKVYYDYDKANIRDDAAAELDKVVELLQQYGGMEIELSSHTDARGRNTYNQSLSQKRAESAVEYIIKKGIDQTRIVGVGYGEAKLINDCRDNVPCKEDDHQLNRRTEIKITKMDRDFSISVQKE